MSTNSFRVPPAFVLCLGLVFHRNFKNSAFEKNKACLVATDIPVSILAIFLSGDATRVAPYTLGGLWWSRHRPV